MSKILITFTVCIDLLVLGFFGYCMATTPKISKVCIDNNLYYKFDNRIMVTIAPVYNEFSIIQGCNSDRNIER